MRLKTSIAIDKGTFRKLRQEAKAQDRSVSYLINKWVDERFKVMGNGKRPRELAGTR